MSVQEVRVLKVAEFLGPGTPLPRDVHCVQRARRSWFARPLWAALWVPAAPLPACCSGMEGRIHPAELRGHQRGYR